MFSHCQLPIKFSFLKLYSISKITEAYVLVFPENKSMCDLLSDPRICIYDLRTSGFSPLLPLPRLPWDPGGVSPEGSPCPVLVLCPLLPWSPGVHRFREEMRSAACRGARSRNTRRRGVLYLPTPWLPDPGSGRSTPNPGLFLKTRGHF